MTQRRNYEKLLKSKIDLMKQEFEKHEVKQKVAAEAKVDTGVIYFSLKKEFSG